MAFRASKYFRMVLETNTPNEVLGSLAAPPSEYKNSEGEQKKCRNYNISSRAKS